MFEVGEVFDTRYEVKRELASTNTAILLLVYDSYLKRHVVLKALLPEQVHHEEVVKVFVKEAEVLARLEHPNILPIYDFKPQGTPYFTTRHIPEGTIRTLLQTRRPSTREVLALAQRLASALDYLNAAGIVHRNISPDHILLGSGDHPYVFEFGYSKVQDRTDIFTAEMFASMQYISPEILNEAPSIDHRADLFSFGILLYECLVGEPPIQSKNPFGASLAMLQSSGKMESLPSVRQVNASLPVGVDVVLNRLTRFDPQERYNNFADAVEDLTRVFYSGHGQIEGTVFISYARKDKDFVYRLANELERVGLDIWIDRNIQPGANWDHEVEHALEKCSKLLLIASPSSMQSENVQDEWSYFLEEGKPVYPFIYQETELSFRLRRRQYILSSGDLLNDVGQIVDMLVSGEVTGLSNG